MHRCDTAASAELSASLALLCSSPGLPPVAGFMNSGGVLADAVLGNQTASSIRTVYAPKLVSVALWDSSCSGLPVGQSLLFSSVSSLVGWPGQANYAAANAALESWASGALAQGHNSLAIQWGAWALGKSQLSSVWCG